MSEFGYRLRRFLYQEFIPVTKTIAIISGVMFLLSFIPGVEFIFELLGLNPGNGFLMPWTLVTYPFLLYRDILSAIFAILWLWMAGGSLERSWGSQTYGLFLLLVTLITGVAMSLLGLLHLVGGFSVSGLWLPLVGLTWAWAATVPDQEVMFWGIIPLKARVLAWIDAIITFFVYFRLGTAAATTIPLLAGLLVGLASLSGIAVTHLFTGNGPLSKGYRSWAWKQGTVSRGRRERTASKSGRKRFRIIK